MARAGFRGVGWLFVLCGVSCGSAPMAKGGSAQPHAKVAPARAEVPVPPQPPLTPPPPSVLEAQVTVDFARLVANVTASTNARLDLRAMAEVWRPGFELESAMVVGFSGNGAPPKVERPSPDRELRDGHLMELELGLIPNASSPVHEWRASATRQLDALLPEASELGKQKALRLGLIDVGFELIDRVVDSYKRIGDLRVALLPRQGDGFGVSAAIAPAAGSALARAAAAASNVRIPEAFWDLPTHTNEAVFFDAGLLSPLWEVSPRSQALLAEAGAGSLAQQLAALPAVCARPGQAWTVASANQLEPETKSAAPVSRTLPELSDFPSGAEPELASYTLLGIEDPQGACGKALRAVFSAQQRLAQVPDQAADQRYFSALPAEKGLPATVQVFRLGTGEDATHLALAERKGVLWIGDATDLALLKAGLTDLLVPTPKRRGLRSRPELAALGKSAALVSGFVREDGLPFAAWIAAPRRRFQAAKSASNADLRRVPFAITKEQATLRLSGVLEARLLQQLLAKSLLQKLDFADLKRLPPDKLPSALGLLEGACHLGNGEACNVLGVTYGDARGVPKDLALALRWLEAGCTLKEGMACANIAFYKTLDKAQELAQLQKSCELGSAFGCAWWGVKLLERDEPSDQQLGLEKLASACNGFVGFACVRIANHYREGVGLPQDDEKGADFFERGCALGQGSGCLGFATALATGKGRKQDAPSAFQYVQRSCELDKKEGCYALGMSYLYGQITTKDEAAARHQLQVACDANHADACRVLAELSGEP